MKHQQHVRRPTQLSRVGSQAPRSRLRGAELGWRGWIAKRTAKSTASPEGNPASLRVAKNRSATAPQRKGAKKVLPRANHPHVLLPLHLLEPVKPFWLKLSM